MSNRKPTALSHEDACRAHCANRAWQRYGLALHVTDVREMERQIVGGSAQWIMDQPHRDSMRVVYWVRRDSKRMIAVFDLGLWCMRTILPGLGFLRGVGQAACDDPRKLHTRKMT